MKNTSQTTREDAQDIERIFDLLEQGAGRECVNDSNVDQLIERAHDAGRTILETELREWKAPC